MWTGARGGGSAFPSRPQTPRTRPVDLDAHGVAGRHPRLRQALRVVRDNLLDDVLRRREGRGGKARVRGAQLPRRPASSRRRRARVARRRGDRAAGRSRNRASRSMCASVVRNKPWGALCWTSCCAQATRVYVTRCTQKLRRESSEKRRHFHWSSSPRPTTPRVTYPALSSFGIPRGFNASSMSRSPALLRVVRGAAVRHAAASAARAASGGSPAYPTGRLIVFDTTLRDGEQSPGCTLQRAEKLAVRAWSDLGAVAPVCAAPPTAPTPFPPRNHHATSASHPRLRTR